MLKKYLSAIQFLFLEMKSNKEEIFTANQRRHLSLFVTKLK